MSSSVPRAGNQLFDLWHDPGDDHRHPGGGRVESVALIELGIGGDAGEKERIQDGASLSSEVRIDGVEGAAKLGTQIGWRQHSAQQNRDFALKETMQHRIERLASEGRIDAAQRVV